MLSDFYKSEIGKVNARALVNEKHFENLRDLKLKKTINVVFMVFDKAVWKFDTLFSKMQGDDFFNPIILVCPYVQYGKDRMYADLESTYSFFKNKGYQTFNSLVGEDSWFDIEELKPDIVFFTNPHPLTVEQYYSKVYLNYLTCYAGYGLVGVHFTDGQMQYNYPFHNFLWKNFVSDYSSYDFYNEISAVKNKTVHVVGDTNIEYLLDVDDSSNTEGAWSENSIGLKKIIWAPHHTISDDWFALSSFLKFHDFFIQLAKESQETIFWSFKPHPVLKEKLYLHPDWGKEKTDEYYEFWRSSKNTQYDDSDYKELFLNSDALILCSASFLGEYLFIDKPMSFVMNDGAEKYFNEFGHDCLSATDISYTEKDIKTFISNVLATNDFKAENRKLVTRKYSEILGEHLSPSDAIILHLKSALGFFDRKPRKLELSEQPKLSVCIASYNHDKYIYSALESVVSQDYENLEIIVVDDCSTDNSVSEIERFAKKYPIKFIQQEKNQGPSLTTNRAISEAEGEFIALLGSDDLMLPGRLHAQARYLLENKHCVAVMTDIAVVGDDGNVFQSSKDIEGQFNQTYYNLRRQLLAGNFINAPSAMVRREDLLAVQSFSPLLRYVQDYDLWGKLLTRGEINKISMPLTGYRVHGKNLSFGLQGSELAQTRVELVSTIVSFARSWSMQAIAQLTKISAKQEAEIMLGLASILQLVDYNYFKKPSLATSQAYEFILKASYTEPEKAQIAKAQIEAVIANGFSSAEALLTDEAVKWFGDLLPRLNVLAEVDSSPKEASVEKWLSARTILPKQKAVVQQLTQNKNIKISCSCVIANFDNNSEALAQTQKSIELQQGALSALTLNPIQVVKRDTFAAQVNEWLHKSDDDWLLVMSAGEELTSSGLIMAQIELSQNPALSAISFDEIYRQHDGELGAALRPSVNLDYLLSFPAGMSRHWLFSRQALLDIGGFNAEFPEAVELDALLRLISVKGLGCLGHIPEPLVITPMPVLANVDDERKVIESFLQMQGYANEQLHAPDPGRYQIRYNHPSQPVVSVLLAAGKNLQNLQRCVEGLLGNTSYQNFEILFIKQPDSGVEVKEWLAGLAAMQEPKLKVIATEHTILSTQYHDAEAQAIGDYLLFLSPDTAVISEHWLDEILNHAQRSEVGVVGVKLLTPDGQIAHAGHILGLEGPVGSPFVGDDLDAPGYMQRLQVAQNLSAVGGDCMMVLRELFVQLGGFADSSLADQYLSSDLCLRAREAGFLIVWTPHAQLMLEKHGMTAPTAEQQDVMYEKWLPQLARDPAYNPNFSLSMPGGFKLADSQISWRPLDSIRPTPVALVHPADLFGCGHYRVMQPFIAMKEAGLVDGAISTGLMHVTDLERYNPDTIILQRQIGDDRLEAMQRMQRFSKAFKVYELDDYLPNLPIKSVHRAQMPKDILKSLRKGLGFVDRFVVSTEALADAFTGLHGEIVVMENRLPVTWWQGLDTKRRQGRKPRVGWAGGAGHTGDLELIADVVRDLADEVEWVFFGMCPDKLRPYIHEYHEGVAIETYPEKLASLNLDLGLAPLEINLFNECKSNLRLLEYGACGIPVICTDIRPYQNDFPVMRVRNRYKEWVNAIRMHLSDLDETARLGDALQAKVRQEWMLDGANLQNWRDAWLKK